MRFVPLRNLSLIAAGIAVIIGLGCSDATAPLSHRIAGTYVLTTDLETYTYSNSCHLTNNGTVCADTTIAAGPSKLYGTFTLADTSAGRSGNMGFTIPGASFHQAGCALTSTYTLGAALASTTAGPSSRSDSPDRRRKGMAARRLSAAAAFRDRRARACRARVARRAARPVSHDGRGRASRLHTPRTRGRRWAR